MIARPTRSDWLLLLILGLMWGTSYAFIKLGVENGLPTFTLIATDFAPGELPPGLTREQITEKFGSPPSPHVKGVAGLVGLFVNPYPK